MQLYRQDEEMSAYSHLPIRTGRPCRMPTSRATGVSGSEITKASLTFHRMTLRNPRIHGRSGQLKLLRRSQHSSTSKAIGRSIFEIGKTRTMLMLTCPLSIKHGRCGLFHLFLARARKCSYQVNETRGSSRIVTARLVFTNTRARIKSGKSG
jgi:hypothetical protein